MKMNRELRTKVGMKLEEVIGYQMEDLLTVGSKIFYQTHFYPLIKMQNFVREIYLVFKGAHGHIPALFNVEVKQINDEIEILCGGMEISKRNKYEKELLIAKKAAEEALTENVELTKTKHKLLENQTKLELKYREVKLLKEQQKEVFKLIAHDLQEPLRKAIFMSNYILNTKDLSQYGVDKLNKIKGYNTTMSEMLLTLLRFKELEGIELVYEKINLNEILSSATNALKIQDKKHITITNPQKPHDFIGDKKLIERLFVELLRNSQKDHNPKNQNLIIKITAVNTVKNSYFEINDTYQYIKFLKITYNDNGIGFNSKLEKIIQKSEQFNKVNIGLAYSKQIVEKHSGAMAAKSVIGKGLTYTILLPLEPILKNS